RVGDVADAGGRAALGARGDERAGGRAAGGRAAVARALVAVLARVGRPVSARGDHGGEALAEDAIVAAVLEVALPDDDEVARRVRSDGGERLRIVRLRVDPELGALRYPAAAEALPEDAKAVTGALLVAVPHHGEVARRVGRHRGITLRARRVGVHLELGALRGAAAAVALAEDAKVVAAALLPGARPHDHEVARPVGGDGRVLLVVGRVSVHPELGALRGPAAAVALADDAPAAESVHKVLPHHHEVA